MSLSPDDQLALFLQQLLYLHNYLNDRFPVPTIPWNWLVGEVVQCSKEIVAPHIFMSHIKQKWKEYNVLGSIASFKKLSQSGFFRFHCVDIEQKSICIATLRDQRNKEMKWYLPTKFTNFLPFIKSSIVRMANCQVTFEEQNKLLPTEYAVFEVDYHENLFRGEANQFNGIFCIQSLHLGVTSTKKKLVLEKPNRNESVNLYLKNYSLFRDLLKEGEIIYLANVQEVKQDQLVMTKNTVIFVMTGKTQLSHLFETSRLTQFGQILLRDIKPFSGYRNILAVCKSIGPNSPVLFKNGLTNRRLITCGDGSIDISITAWDKVCAHLDSINPGQIILFERIATSIQSEGTFYTNCTNGKIVVVELQAINNFLQISHQLPPKEHQ